jgi:hypothetical protein
MPRPPAAARDGTGSCRCSPEQRRLALQPVLQAGRGSCGSCGGRCSSVSGTAVVTRFRRVELIDDCCTILDTVLESTVTEAGARGRIERRLIEPGCFPTGVQFPRLHDGFFERASRPHADVNVVDWNSVALRGGLAAQLQFQREARKQVTRHCAEVMKTRCQHPDRVVGRGAENERAKFVLVAYRDVESTVGLAAACVAECAAVRRRTWQAFDTVVARPFARLAVADTDRPPGVAVEQRILGAKVEIRIVKKEPQGWRTACQLWPFSEPYQRDATTSRRGSGPVT